MTKFVINPKPQWGIMLPYTYKLIDKVEDVWIGNEILFEIANSERPHPYFRGLGAQQAAALVDAGWLIEHEKPHPKYYDEPFWPSEEFLKLWPALAEEWSKWNWDHGVSAVEIVALDRKTSQGVVSEDEEL